MSSPIRPVSHRHAIQAWVTQEEKRLVTELALRQQRSESCIVRKAIEHYAKLLGVQVTVTGPQGRNRPLSHEHREKISQALIRKHAERRRGVAA